MRKDKLFIIVGTCMLMFSKTVSADTVRVATFQEPVDPVFLTTAQTEAWNKVGTGLKGMWGDRDRRHSRSILPDCMDRGGNSLTAWRGERTAAELLLWSADSISGVRCEIGDFYGPEGKLSGAIADARFVRYTIGNIPYVVGGDPILVPDMLDTLKFYDMAARTVRPVWISVQVPRDAVPGTYSTDVKVTSNNGDVLLFPLNLTVQNHTLAAPSDWKYHLDLWQHPSAVARTEGVKVWSDEHFAAMRPVMERLRDAGQKVITATLNKDPWNHQCYDGYENMIEWTRLPDGTWSYDYTVFDRWVGMMMEIGIKDMINCYSMVPWNCELEYYDQAKGEKVTVVAEPGTTVFEEIWKPFLIDFKKHLATKGWLEITNMAMDERAPEQMDAAVNLLAKYAPEMGFAIADMHKSYKRYAQMRDVCVAQEQPADLSDILERRKKGLNTTFYVCCNPRFPNTFSNSQPYEAELLGWYGLALDYDGMLRWAYNSWTEDPATDSRFGNWNSGDTFLVYPGNRSTVRFERLIEGIQSAEKVRTLRKQGVDVSGVDNVLEQIRCLNVNDPTLPWRQIVMSAKSALNKAGE